LIPPSNLQLSFVCLLPQLKDLYLAVKTDGWMDGWMDRKKERKKEREKPDAKD